MHRFLSSLRFIAVAAAVAIGVVLTAGPSAALAGPAQPAGCGPVPPTTATLVSNPTPTLTPSGHFYYTGVLGKLRKELSGYGRYGAGDGKADILYDGQAASWSFDMAVFAIDAPLMVKVRVAIVADDHYATSTSGHILRVWANGQCQFNGPAGLPHGTPYGGPFTNWTVREYIVRDVTVTPTSRYFTVSIANTGAVWYAVDWIELEVAVDISGVDVVW